MILWFEGDDGSTAYLMVHLRMTGQFFILDEFVPDKHVHLTFDFDGYRPRPGPVPLLGEHTDEILQELGFNQEKIKSLREESVIG